MYEEPGPEIEEWLREEGRRPIPDPSPDLIARTLQRVQGWVLARDLVGFATLEGVWSAWRRQKIDAQAGEERQDS